MGVGVSGYRIWDISGRNTAIPQHLNTSTPQHRYTVTPLLRYIVVVSSGLMNLGPRGSWGSGNLTRHLWADSSIFFYI